MKAKINYKSKKTIIIIAIAVVLLIAAITGTVAFIKGNNNAAAAMENSEITEPANNGNDSNNNGGVENANTPNTENPQEQIPTIDENQNQTTPAQNGNTTTGTTNPGTTTGTTTGNAGTTVPDTEYTQTTVVENPWKTEDITWMPISLQAITETTGLNINTPNLEVSKTAYVGNQEISAEPVNTVAQPGQEITYVIRIKNTGNLPTSTIRTIDAIPEGTEIVKGTISEGGVLANGKITWKNVIKAGETVELTFKVKVISETEITLISNTAKVNGEDTPTTETPVVTTAKDVYVVVDGDLANAESAKVGDTLRYIITISNNSEVAGKTIVTDNIPEGTTLVEGTISEGGKLEGNTITWNNVEVVANGETTVSFDVTINQDRTESVTNVAIVGEKETPPTETKIANITTTKASTPSATPLHELDKIRYTLTSKNTGNTTGTVTITDIIPEGTTVVKETISKGGVLEGKTITWNNVEVAANGETTVSFEVTINPFESETKTIVNDQAKQDGNPINSTTDEAEKVYVDITVSKSWKDNEIQAQRRPTQIRFELYANGEYTNKYYNMSTEKDNTYIFAKQPKYSSNGNVINYTIKETEINVNDLKFYESTKTENTDNSGNKTYNFTNTFRKPTDTKKITVTKKWDDNNNAAHKRAEKVTLQLNGKDITLSANNASPSNGNIWSIETDVDIYDDNGEEINYIATEKDVPQWYEKVEDGTTTVTNKFKAPTEEKYDITLEKIWDDNNNNAEKRPSSVKFDLYKINVNQEEELVEKDIELKGDSKTDKWSIPKNVQKYDEKANVIEYFVVENETGSIFYEKTEQTGLSVTNKFTVPDTTTEIPVTKIWNDRNNVNRTDKVEFKITGNDSTNNSKTVELTRTNALAENGNVWTTKVTELRKYNKTNGNEIEYSVEEINIPEGYIMTKNGNEITNSLPGIEVTKVVKKVNDIEAKGDITVKADDVIEYEIIVKNIGTVELQDLTVTDNLKVYTNKEKPEVTTNTLAENVTLNVEETKNYTVYYKVTAEDAKTGAKTLRNTATASAKYTDSNKKEQTVEDYDNADVTIKELPGVEIVKTQKVNEKDVTESTKVEPGDVIDYTITVTNTGNTILNNVTVDDSMLNQKTFKTIEGKWEIGTLEIGSHVTIKAKYTVQEEDMEKGKVQNVATVTTTTPTEKKQDEVEVPTIEWKSDISVKKESNLVKADGNTISEKAEYGDTIKYTITATNKGRKQGTIDITDKVPEGTTLKETNNDTNLTTEELGKLTTTDGLTKTLTVAGNDGKNDGVESIYFEVIVTAKPGEKVQNIATASDNTKPEEPGYNVEKKVSVKAKSQIPTIKNSNVVIVLDVSGSMNYKPNGNKAHRHEETRLYAAKQACNNLIDGMFKDGATGCQVSVVTFSSKNYNERTRLGDDNEQTIGTATNGYEAITLKKDINKLEAGGGTRIAAGIKEANTEINRLAQGNNNKNIVIVLSDGDFTINNDGTINQSAGETKKRVKDESENLKNSNCRPTVYAVAFASKESGLMKDTIASDPNSTFKTASDYSSLLNIFTEIGSEIGEGENVDAISENGLIKLPKLDANKDVTIKINGETSTGKVDTFGDKIIQINGEYHLDTTKFDADAKIEIEYVEITTSNN